MAKQDNDYIDSFFLDDDSSDLTSDAAASAVNSRQASQAAPVQAAPKSDSSFQFSSFEEQDAVPAGRGGQKISSDKKKVRSSAEVTAVSRKALRASSAAVKQKAPNKKIKREIAGRRRFQIFRGIVRWAKEIAIVLILAWFLTTFIAQNVTVSGLSMSPNLLDGDMLIVNKVTYRFMEPERGDVVIFNYRDTETGETEILIKRVVGLPSDEIEIMDGRLLINGEVYDESRFISTDTKTLAVKGSSVRYPYKIPDDCYFVLGDNRSDSLDSRYFGVISRDQIIGIAFFRFWPLDSIGMFIH